MDSVYYLADHGLGRLAESFEPEFRAVAIADWGEAPPGSVVLASSEGLRAAPERACARRDCFYLVVLGGEEGAGTAPEIEDRLHALVSPAENRRALVQHARNGLRLLEARREAEEARSRLHLTSHIMQELNRIGAALSSERDTDLLLEMIVSKSREITSSDAASLYLVEPGEEGGERLRFKFTQNFSVQLPFHEFVLPIDETSIAGFVAETAFPQGIEDVYDLPPDSPFGFNRSFDEQTGYRTKSMLVVPMVNAYGHVIAVLQLINHKTDPQAILDGPEAAERFVTDYPPGMLDIALSLGSQAAVALENSILYQDIRRLFDGFVRAAVTAIEQRDPTTSGHSFRVADLTVGLAEAVDRVDGGRFQYTHFTRDQVTEIRYASLLHDFGKVGVRERVLVKAKKLYPRELELLRWRFEAYRRVIQLEYSERKREELLRRGRDEYLSLQPEIDAELARELEMAGELWNVILKSNEPTVLAEGSFDRIVAIAQRRLKLFDGSETPLLGDDEARTLSIPRGSLNEAERREIEQHVVHTFAFLSRIPWTSEWNQVPRIAAMHHEKLDGRGYPYGVAGDEIPVQSRMMTISDIFDALTASDRPYKKAVPVDKALDIIGSEVRAGYLDGDLFDLFLGARVYDRVIARER